MAFQWINPKEFSFNCLLLMDRYLIRMVCMVDDERYARQMGIALANHPAVAWYCQTKAPEAVSYTHLDVYKRQPPCCICLSAVCSAFCCIGGGGQKRKRAGILRRNLAVHYKLVEAICRMHAPQIEDVYKRQGKEDKIQLVFRGVSVHCQDNAPLFIQQADKVFITLEEGTANAFSDGGAYALGEELSLIHISCRSTVVRKLPLIRS